MWQAFSPTKAAILALLLAGVLAMAAAALRMTRAALYLRRAAHVFGAVALVIAAAAILASLGSFVPSTASLFPRSGEVTAHLVPEGRADRVATLHVPRADLSFVSGRPQISALPDEFETRGWLTVEFAVPYDQPLAQEGRRRRYESTLIEVHVKGASPAFAIHYRSAKAAKQAVFLPESDDDLFDLITCYDKDRHASFFCNYYKRLNDHVYLKVQFVDLRFHGGRAFANERLRAALQKYCAYDDACGWSGD
jgi:hypothetical protein